MGLKDSANGTWLNWVRPMWMWLVLDDRASDWRFGDNSGLGIGALIWWNGIRVLFWNSRKGR